MIFETKRIKTNIKEMKYMFVNYRMLSVRDRGEE